MKTVCETDKCTGCMACVACCNRNAITIVDSLDKYNAVIDIDKCVNCGLCEKICQNNNLAYPLIKPVRWYQGWANEKEIRENASSGGAATAIMRAFIENEGYVCSCIYDNGEFRFAFAKNTKEIYKFSGSKYIKSNPERIYEKVKNYLKENKKILFLGLPCQVAALKNYVGEKLEKNLYTIDLICHGTPSPNVMKIFLEQYGKDISQQKSFSFRDKAQFQLEVSGKYLVHKGVMDKYSIAFLNALIYTENCYSCKYACIERISDITLGDSWGSELNIEEQKKGISLILIQTEKGKQILEKAKIHIESVDLEKAIESNHQLKHPSIKYKKSVYFWKRLKENKSFNILVWKSFPKTCLRQSIKNILLKMKIIHR